VGQYYRKCARCGALLDPGEVCQCDAVQGARLAATPAPVVIRIADKPTIAEKAAECDRALLLAAREYRAAKAARYKRRRRK